MLSGYAGGVKDSSLYIIMMAFDDIFYDEEIRYEMEGGSSSESACRGWAYIN